MPVDAVASEDSAVDTEMHDVVIEQENSQVPTHGSDAEPDDHAGAP